MVPLRVSGTRSAGISVMKPVVLDWAGGRGAVIEGGSAVECGDDGVISEVARSGLESV